jgi:hypothetical protein
LKHDEKAGRSVNGLNFLKGFSLLVGYLLAAVVGLYASWLAVFSVLAPGAFEGKPLNPVAATLLIVGLLMFAATMLLIPIVLIRGLWTGRSVRQSPSTQRRAMLPKVIVGLAIGAVASYVSQLLFFISDIFTGAWDFVAVLGGATLGWSILVAVLLHFGVPGGLRPVLSWKSDKPVEASDAAH